MKKSTLLFFALVIGISAFAQVNKQGVISYLEKMKIDIKIDGASEEMLKMIPKESKSTKILYFNENYSSYENSKEDESGMAPGSLGGGVKIHMSQPDNKVFYDFKSKKKIEQKEFMTRRFLITEDIPKNNWKLTGQQKVILDYACQQATQITEKDTISAWFTPQIQVSAGPSNYINLPGMVLEVDINHGKRVITAQKIELKKIDKELIKKPKKGKKVSREEYKKIVEEKTKEMGAESGEGKTIIMEVSR